MHVQHFPVSQDMAHGIVVGVFTTHEWDAMRKAVNRVAVEEPRDEMDDRELVFWRQCRKLAEQMHG